MDSGEGSAMPYPKLSVATSKELVAHAYRAAKIKAGDRGVSAKRAVKQPSLGRLLKAPWQRYLSFIKQAELVSHCEFYHA